MDAPEDFVAQGDATDALRGQWTAEDAELAAAAAGGTVAEQPAVDPEPAEPQPGESVDRLEPAYAGPLGGQLRVFGSLDGEEIEIQASIAELIDAAGLTHVARVEVELEALNGDVRTVGRATWHASGEAFLRGERTSPRAAQRFADGSTSPAGQP